MDCGYIVSSGACNDEWKVNLSVVTDQYWRAFWGYKEKLPSARASKHSEQNQHR